MEYSIDQVKECKRILNEKYKLIPCSKCGGKMNVADIFDDIKTKQGYFELTPKISIVCEKCKDTKYFKIADLLAKDV